MFHCPCAVSISGISGSGKTHLTYKIIENRSYLFNEEIKKVLFAYSIWQPFYSKIETELNVQFIEGLPTIDYLNDFTNGEYNTILILDDLMNQVVKSTEIETVFTRLSHHKKINLIFINQNIYCQGKNSKTISLNTHYCLLLRNPRDISQIKNLARQVGMNNTLVEAYMDCTKQAYGYLLIDLSPQPHKYVLKTKIFPNEHMIVYLPIQ